MDPKQIVHSDPDIVSGTPVFVGTRVPAQALLDYLEGGETIEEFLDNFPSVSREQAVAFLEEAGGRCSRASRETRPAQLDVGSRRGLGHEYEFRPAPRIAPAMQQLPAGSDQR